MNYDDWKAHDPTDDEDYNRPTPCATKDCDGTVTFPDFQSFCSRCLIRFDERKKQLEEQPLVTVPRI